MSIIQIFGLFSSSHPCQCNLTRLCRYARIWYFRQVAQTQYVVKTVCTIPDGWFPGIEDNHEELLYFPCRIRPEYNLCTLCVHIWLYPLIFQLLGQHQLLYVSIISLKDEPCCVPVAVWELVPGPARQLLPVWGGLRCDRVAWGRPMEWRAMQLPPLLHLQEGPL